MSSHYARRWFGTNHAYAQGDGPEAHYQAWLFFKEHGGWATPPGPAACALALVHAERDAVRRGLVFSFEWDDVPWEGDEPLPEGTEVYWCFVARSDDVDDETGQMCSGCVPLASVGGVTVDGPRAAYLRVVRAELFAEALGELDKEDGAEADLLAQRATFAAGSPA